MYTSLWVLASYPALVLELHVADTLGLGYLSVVGIGILNLLHHATKTIKFLSSSKIKVSFMDRSAILATLTDYIQKYVDLF